MAATSRLVKYERRQAVRSALLYVVLTAAILYALSRFGAQLVTSFTGVFSTNKDSGSDSTTVVAPPQLSSLPEITNQKTVTASGSAPAGLTVRLTLNGEKQDILSNSQGQWNIGFNLQEGMNTLRAQVVDGQGNTSQEITGTVTLDTKAPEITALTPDDGTTKNGKKEQLLEIDGQTEQDASVKVNDRIAVVNAQGQFKAQLSLSEGDNVFTITVTDRAGNTTQEQRHITYIP